MNGKPQRVAVVGGGIAGSAAAFLLQEQGHNVTLFEQAPTCGPVGAGLLLQPSGQAVLQQCGLLDRIAEESAVLTRLEAVTARGKQLTDLPYAEISASSHALGVHRGTLFSVLNARCRAAGVSILEGHRVTGWRWIDDGLVLTVDDRPELGPFDFLLAADGSSSALRDFAAIHHNLRVRSTEYAHGAMWFVGFNDRVRDRLLQVVSGSNVLIGLLPTGNDACSFFWGERADRWQAVRDAGVAAWKQSVMEYCSDAEPTLDAIESFDQMTFTTYRSVAMAPYFLDRVLFLGDAAHAMSPHLGQGVNLALVDALTFAECFQQTDDFAAACDSFRRRRHRIIRYYGQLTWLLTPFFQSDRRILATGRDVVLPWLPRIPWLRRQMLLTMAGLKTGWWGSLWS